MGADVRADTVNLNFIGQTHGNGSLNVGAVSRSSLLPAGSLPIHKYVLYLIQMYYKNTKNASDSMATAHQAARDQPH